MGDSKLRERLLRLAAELQSIASELSDEAKTEDVSETSSRTHCPICNELLDDGTRVLRGVHARCHKRLSREGRIGEAELAGILLTKEKAGRKTKIDLDTVLPNARSLLETAKKVDAEHRKKHKE